jgi:hypothetical protein
VADIGDTVVTQSGGRKRYVVTQRGGHQRKLLRMMGIRDKYSNYSLTKRDAKSEVSTPPDYSL